jgi:AcrR family transcriptional regulator
VDERRTDTREQIRTIALELFAEHGYDKTSLREIAERLGVTKAAVYYHFRTKEEILVSLIEDFLHEVDDIVGWAASQPAGPATRNGVLLRYSELLEGRTTQLTRFLQEGQASIRDLAAGAEMRRRMESLVGILSVADGAEEARLRARVALITLHLGSIAGPDSEATDRQRRDAALRIARELVGAR